MGHAQHFLERLERLSPAQTDWALALYRDPELVGYLLGRIRLPEGAERIALALEDREDGPHVIVTRDGHFVTCLGAGMSVSDLPVVTRRATDRVTEKLDGARAVLDGGIGESKKLLRRFFRATADLSREDFSALAALMPIQALTFGEVALEMNATVVPAHLRIGSRRRIHGNAEFEREVHAYWTLTWVLSALNMLLSERHDDVDAFTAAGRDLAAKAVRAMSLSCMIVGFDTAMLLRTARAIASMGPSFLPFANEQLIAASDMRQMAVAGTAVCAIGLRHPQKADDAARKLREYRARPLSQDERAIDGIHLFLDTLLGHFDPATRATSVQRIEEIGAERLVEYFGSRSESKRPFLRVEEVPSDVRAAAVVRLQGDLLMTRETLEIGALLAPLAASPDPAGLFLPHEIGRHIPSKFDAGRVAALAYITRWRQDPVRVEKTPGRNDPCPCGSGEKYKRCCGARE